MLLAWSLISAILLTIGQSLLVSKNWSVAQLAIYYAAVNALGVLVNVVALDVPADCALRLATAERSWHRFRGGPTGCQVGPEHGDRFHCDMLKQLALDLGMLNFGHVPYLVT